MTPEHPSSGRLLRRRQIVRAALASALPLALPSLSRGERASAPLVVGGQRWDFTCRSASACY